jgi:hypothetical protein
MVVPLADSICFSSPKMIGFLDPCMESIRMDVSGRCVMFDFDVSDHVSILD